ncbi:MAG: PD-(D/E)XK nuclease family protein [Puniceicoccales bacterium]|jgi:hypothetical protein|nr:PD-(D/E)XK nuclease family protein [Puniceicoccales bacterium]
MATHAIDTPSKAHRWLQSAAAGGPLTLIVPSADDIPPLKSLLAAWESGDGVQIFCGDEFRDHMCRALRLPVKICTNEVLALYFDEAAANIAADDRTGMSIAASRTSVLRAFREILSGGICPNDLVGERLHFPFCAAVEKIERGGFIFANAADAELLRLAKASKRRQRGRAIFYGFSPADGNLAPMAAAAAHYSQADAVVFDFGNAEFVSRWICALENVLGNCHLCTRATDVPDAAKNVTLRVYGSAADEVEAVRAAVENILLGDNSAKIVLCCDRDAAYVPMLLDALESAGIPHCDTIGRAANVTACETIIAMWVDWQLQRNADGLGKFCAELFANGLLSGMEFHAIVGDLSSLQRTCLSKNYDLLLEFANLRNIHSFDAIEKYDIHGARIAFGDFCKRFLGAFRNILAAEKSAAIDAIVHAHDPKEIFFKKNLIKYFAERIMVRRRTHAQSAPANVVIVDISHAHALDFTHAFAIGLSEKFFDHAAENHWLPRDAITSINARAAKASSGGSGGRRFPNRLLMPHEKKYLQTEMFNALRGRGDLWLSFPLRSCGSDREEQIPSRIFTDMLYASSGKFYADDTEAELLQASESGRSARAIFRSPGDGNAKSIAQCAASYAMRHDTSTNLHDYCFAVDRKVGVKLSCSALERMLKNPHIGFYDAVLRLPTMPWQSKCNGAKLASGVFTHEFLQIFGSGKKFTERPSREVFIANIDSRAHKLKVTMAGACAAADAAVPQIFTDAVDSSAVRAKCLVDRLLAISNWKSFCSEFTVANDIPLSIFGENIALTGRIDFLISSGEHTNATQLPCDVTVVDFKTGSDFELTDKNVGWHMERYDGLQLFLYGLALKAAGFRRVGILILKPDSGAENRPVDVDHVERVSQVPLRKLAQVARCGLVERKILGKSFRRYFADDLPLATTDLY